MGRARAQGSRFFALVAFALAVGQPSFANADPSASDRATARRLFAEGLERRRARDLAGALARFRAADSLMGVPTTALELGRVEMELGLLVEAHESLMRAARWSGPPPVPKAFSRAQDEAERLLETLRPRLPTVRVALGSATEDDRYRVVLDGHVVPREAIAQPYAVNPGHHTLALERDGQRVRELAFDVREGAAESLDMAPPEGAVASRPPPPSPSSSTTSPPLAIAPPSTAAPSTPPPLPREGGSDAASASRLSSPVVVTGLVLAGVGLTVGATAGAVTLAKRSEADAACPDAKCEPPAQPTLDAAWTASTVADVGFVTAGVGIAVALTAWLWPRSTSSPSSPSSASPAASATPSSAARGPSPFVSPWVGGVRGLSGGFVF